MSKSKKPMTPKDASRIQSSEAQKNAGVVTKDSFAAKAQRVAQQHINKATPKPTP